MDQNLETPLPWIVQVLNRINSKWFSIAFVETRDLAKDEALRYIQARYTARYFRVDEPTIYYP